MSGTGFVGIDPEAIHGLSAGTAGVADHLSAVAWRLDEILCRCRPAAILADTGMLRKTAEGLTEYAAGMQWRAEVITGLADVPGRPLAEFAAFGTFRSRPGPEQLATFRSGPDPDALTRMSPGEVAAVFAATAPSIGEEMARAHPRLVGSLDGAPPRLRYLANNLLIGERIDELQDLIADLEHPGQLGWLRPLLPPLPIRWHPVRRLREKVAVLLGEHLNRYQSWLAEGRQILLFDPTGDGKVVEVFGDLELAKHVAVVVPGMANDLDGFDYNGSGFREDAAGLQQAAAAASPESATIAWLGYDTPDGADAVLQVAGQEGAPSLRRFLEGIDPPDSRHLTVIAHSYGSVLAGIAASDGLPVDDLVVVGSPGTTLGVAQEARLRPGGRVWAALADGDPIAAGISPSELPPWWLPGVLGPIWFVADMSNGPETLWHGVNPAAETFGALRIATEGCSGHSDYFEAGSLDNLTHIVLGRYSEVELVE